MNSAPRTLNILHTSDLHLGHSLHEINRDAEFDVLLQWLKKTIQENDISVLLIAGDVFDTSNPSHSAQQKYYDFCVALEETCCQHVVITAGNHDSASFIDVPAELMKKHHVHVIGHPRFSVSQNTGNVDDEIIVIKDDANNELAIIAAVPYLNEISVRGSEEAESEESKAEKVIRGVAEHYKRVADRAEEIRASRPIPVIAMGHLVVQNCHIGEDTGVRTTRIGNLGGVPVSIFGNKFDYVALGHIHIPQTIGGRETIRYSGAPLPIGFGEAGQQKSVAIVSFHEKLANVTTVPVPCFHKLARIIGDKTTIENEIQELIDSNEEYYISVIYNGADVIKNVREFVAQCIEPAQNRIICVDTQNLTFIQKLVAGQANDTLCKLEEISPQSVFDRLLQLNCSNMPEEEKLELTKTYNELLAMD